MLQKQEQKQFQDLVSKETVDRDQQEKRYLFYYITLHYPFNWLFIKYPFYLIFIFDTLL